MSSSGTGQLIVISAPSGAGKTTLLKKLLKDYSNLHLSISWTTRPARPKEVEGVDYHFVGKEVFIKARDENEFLEFEKVHGAYYGTPLKEVEARICEGKSVVLDLDTKGALAVKQAYPEAVLVFIQPPSIAHLKDRLKNRGTESDEGIQMRIANAHQEMHAKDQFDYVIINKELDQAYADLTKLIQS
jgi:guanylate kinase